MSKLDNCCVALTAVSKCHLSHTTDNYSILCISLSTQCQCRIYFLVQNDNHYIRDRSKSNNFISKWFLNCSNNELRIIQPIFDDLKWWVESCIKFKYGSNSRWFQTQVGEFSLCEQTTARNVESLIKLNYIYSLLF